MTKDEVDDFFEYWRTLWASDRLLEQERNEREAISPLIRNPS